MNMKLCFFSICFILNSFFVQAENLDPSLHKNFEKRILSALSQGDSLRIGTIFVKDIDKNDLEVSARQLKSCQNNKIVEFEKIKDGQKFEYAHKGYTYAPNLKPLGMINLEECGVRVPYGKQNGQLFVISTIKRLVNANPPPDKMLSILISVPDNLFKGWCDILYSDNKIRREQFKYISASIMGQSIKKCEVENLSKQGTLSLMLTVADLEKSSDNAGMKVVNRKTIFKKEVKWPESKISFNK